MKRNASWPALGALALYAALSLAPVAWLVITGFKSPADATALPPRIFPGDAAPENSLWFRFTFMNYRRMLSELDAVHYFLNSIAVSLLSTAVSVLVGALAGYGFSRFRFRGSRLLQLFILLTRMVPPMAVALPLSFLYSRTGLFDTRFGLILLYTCCNLSFSTWMMKAFFDEIPTAYDDAARLDGYSRVRGFFRVVLPHSGPGLAATAVFCFISSWNEYAFALTLTATEAVTMPVRIHAILGDMGRLPWGPLAAAATLFLLPVAAFGLIMRRHLVRGITFGAVKG